MNNLLILGSLLLSTSVFAANQWVMNPTGLNTQIKHSFSQNLEINEAFGKTYDSYVLKYEQICEGHFNQFVLNSHIAKLGYQLVETPMGQQGSIKRGRVVCELMLAKF